MLIDSHCHLEYKGLVEDQQGVLARGRAAGIGGFLNISTRQREWSQVIGTAAREGDVWASVGIHPHEADQHADLGEGALLAAAEHPRVIGIGEGFLSEPWWCRTLVLAAERVARRGGIVRVSVSGRQLRKPGPRQALLDAVDLALMHGCAPTVYRWRPDPVLEDAA